MLSPPIIFSIPNKFKKNAVLRFFQSIHTLSEQSKFIINIIYHYL